MFQFNTMRCCGWRELHGSQRVTVNTSLESLLQAIVDFCLVTPQRLRCGAILITQAGQRSSYGKKLTKLITDNNLGTVLELPAFRNPNTGRIITSFMWQPNYSAIRDAIADRNITRSDPYYFY